MISFYAFLFLLFCFYENSTDATTKKMAFFPETIILLVFYGLMMNNHTNGFKLGLSGEAGLDIYSIIDGSDAEIFEFPYIANILLKNYNENVPYCGGSIISQIYILTAAHCVDHNFYDEIKIGVGQASPEYDFVYDIANITVHEEYSDRFAHADIAIIALKKPLKYSKTVQPVKLPQPNHILFDNTAMIVSGWGHTDDQGTHPKILQYTLIYKINSNKCRLFYDSFDDGMLCAGNNDVKNSCNGDSGGPLVSGDIQYGIVSYGTIKCITTIPAVYTNVGYYRNWITEKTGL